MEPEISEEAVTAPADEATEGGAERVVGLVVATVAAGVWVVTTAAAKTEAVVATVAVLREGVARNIRSSLRSPDSPNGTSPATKTRRQVDQCCMMAHSVALVVAAAVAEAAAEATETLSSLEPMLTCGGGTRRRSSGVSETVTKACVPFCAHT